jgi:mannose-1-phosphate guanylyltransferase/phosphomannomutase
MVLCAGYGTRLGDVARETPKPMLPLGDRPMLEYILCHLKRHGFDEIAVNLHFMPDVIRNHFGDGARWGLRLAYSYEPQLLGTAGGTRKMAPFFQGDGPFLVQYGDVVTNQDLTAMLQFHRQRRALATLLVHRRAKSNSALRVDATGCIEQFLERPSDAQRDTIAGGWVFSGITICQPELLEMIPPRTFCDFPRDVFTPLAPARRLFAFPLSGQRVAVDSPERLAEARQAVAEGLYIPRVVETDTNPKRQRGR